MLPSLLISAVIMVAGDRAANLVFLPKGAAAVDLVPAGYPETSTWTIRTVRDLSFLWLGYAPALNQRHKLLSITEASAKFQSLSSDQQTGVRLSQCPNVDMQQTCHEMWWYGSQIEVLTPIFEEALSRALVMIGQSSL